MKRKIIKYLVDKYSKQRLDSITISFIDTYPTNIVAQADKGLIDNKLCFRIAFNKKHINSYTIEQLRFTVLHEIAHLLTLGEEDHGPCWHHEFDQLLRKEGLPHQASKNWIGFNARIRDGEVV